MKEQRETIPAITRRQLLLESGYKCSIPTCSIQMPTLQFHHIDENPSNSIKENLLILCPTHHQMVTSNVIDKKSCILLKEMLTKFEPFRISERQESKSKCILALSIELLLDKKLIEDQIFTHVDVSGKNKVFPRILHVIMDQVVSSGIFINDDDMFLFSKLFNLAEIVKDFNRRLDITENRLFTSEVKKDEIIEWHKTISEGTTINVIKERLSTFHLLLKEKYPDESEISDNQNLIEGWEILR
jgi:hypothetical protein